MEILDHLDKLKIFIAVAQRGSISAASQELALTQPAITRAIQTLENAAGYPLFSRNRGMQLTQGGQILFETAGRVLKEVGDATLRGAHVRTEMAGTFTIGTFETLAEYLWPDFLLKVQKDYPLINLSLKTDSQRSHLEELNNGTLDLLVDAEPRHRRNLAMWPLYTDRFSFYATKTTTELNPETAKGLTLLFVRNAFDEDDVAIEGHLKNVGYQFQQEYTFDSFTTVKRMAEKGLGVAVLPQRLADKEGKLKLIKAKGFKEGFGHHGIFATVSPHRENDKRVKTLVSLLRKQLS